MVSDMQHALNRVPNELANASKMELENLTTKKTLPELKPTLETFDKEVYVRKYVLISLNINEIYLFCRKNLMWATKQFRHHEAALY